MELKKACMVLGLSAVFCVSASPFGEAHQLDRYRAIMGTEQYTIEYEDTTLQVEKMDGASEAKKDVANIEEVKSPRATMTRNGDDECVMWDYGNGSKGYILVKDGNSYVFRQINGKWSSKEGKSKLQAVQKNLVENFKIYGEKLGPDGIFSVIVPPEKKAPGIMDYEFAGDGWLLNGMTYEDYRSKDDAGLHAARFYFQGGTLVKIAGAFYDRDAKGQMRGHKRIVDIASFSGVPTMTLLHVPSGLTVEDD